MIVRNWMKANPMVIDSDTLLSEAKRILTENNLHGLPVVDLYTAFMTAGECGSLVSNGTLTPRGMEQAIDALRRVLYGAPFGMK